MNSSFETPPEPTSHAKETVRRALRSGALDILRAGLTPIQHAQQALVERDWPTLARIMHGLRGAAGNFDSGQFAAAAWEVENAIKGHLFDQVAARLEVAAERYGILLDATAHRLEDEQSPSQDPDGMETTPLTASTLQYLLQQLDSQSFSAIDEFERLRPALAEQDASMADIVEQQLERLDFKAAAAHLRALAATLGLVLAR